MKQKIKRIALCALFCTIVIALFLILNSFSLNEVNNRYYALEQILADENKTYDLHIYGSCHAYSSFDAGYFEDTYQVSSYVFANPSEIIPVTYLRMAEQFKKDTPKYALVDVWGMNPYDTYLTPESILGENTPVNIELLPHSPEKTEVIRDFPEIASVLEVNVPLLRYKERFLSRTISQLDFQYSFDLFTKKSVTWIGDEMKLRKNNNGFLPYYYTNDVSEFFDAQPVINSSELLPYESNLMKYLEKIVQLCDDNNVKLILYRAPYTMTENECRKTNWLEQYCNDNNITYCNLEQEVSFDHSSDFYDQWHLNVDGAKKATDFLATLILKEQG